MIYIPLAITLYLGYALLRKRNQISDMVTNGDLNFGRASERLALHFLLTVCELQAVWFLWFVWKVYS